MCAGHCIWALTKSTLFPPPHPPPARQVIIYDKLDACDSLANLRASLASPSCRFVQGDILSADLLAHVLQQHDIDTVLHFAAQVVFWGTRGSRVGAITILGCEG